MLIFDLSNKIMLAIFLIVMGCGAYVEVIIEIEVWGVRGAVAVGCVGFGIGMRLC